MTLAVILRWIAVVLLVDASIGLLGLNVWQKKLPRFPIRRIALIEAAVGLVLVGVSFVM